MTKSNGIERAEGGEDRYEVLLFSVSSSESIFLVELTTHRRAFSEFRSSRLPICAIFPGDAEGSRTE